MQGMDRAEAVSYFERSHFGFFLQKENKFFQTRYSFFWEKWEADGILFCFSKRKRLAKKKRDRETFRMVSPDPSIDQSLALDLRQYGVGKSTIEYVRGR